MGWLAAPRYAMLTAALKSALAAKPHDRQRKEDWPWRLAFSQCLHALHVLLVFRASTRTTGTPTNAALYSICALSWAKAQDMR